MQCRRRWAAFAGAYFVVDRIHRDEGGLKEQPSKTKATSLQSGASLGECQYMSTPTGKPRIPTDLSDPVPHQARAHSDLLAAEYDSLRARLAANPVRERADVEPRPAGTSDHDPLRSAYAPMRSRSAAEPGEASARGDAEPPYAAVPLQPAHPEPPGAPAAGRDEVVSERDLDRLEASLRWLQRQEAAARPAPRPAPALAPHETRYPGGERAALRLPLSLEPERMGPPPLGARRDPLAWVVRILIASCVVAPVLYYFSAEGPGPAPEPAPPQLASLKPSFAAPPSTLPAASGPIGPRADDPGTTTVRAASVRQADASPTQVTAAETVAPPQPSEAAPPRKPVRALDPEEIALLMKQGEQFVAAGDLAAARTVFQRAAEAGDATAAVALAATYDPTVLEKLGVVGIGGDVEKARNWYQKAESLGSAEATRRLHILAKR